MATPGGLWRITDRATFAALRTGRRARCGTVSVTYLPPAPGATEARVGFQVGKATGNAVVRNRIRRRLRAALRDLRAADALPAGSYLVGGHRELADAPWAQVLDDVRGAVTGATQPGARA